MPILLSDVHPPLYQAALGLWIAAFGDSEVATRLMSLIAVVGGLAVYPVMARRFSPVMARLFLIVILANWLVWFYAQEARSYGLLFALSLWLFALLAADERRWVLAVAVLLGLTHFFGTLKAAIALLWLLAEKWRDPGRVLACTLCLAVLAAWPVAMVLSGAAALVSGGQFWIGSSPGDALAQALMAGQPVLAALAGVAVQQVGIWVVVALGAVGLVLAVRGRARAEPAVGLAAVLLGVMTAVVVLISIHTPVATLRNFIVLVPPAAFLLAAGLMVLLRRRGWRLAGAGLVLVLALGGQVQIAEVLARKTAPQHDWRETAARTEAHLAEFAAPRLLLYTGFSLGGPDFMRRLQSYYLHDELETELLDVIAQDRLSSGTVIHFGHVGPPGTGMATCENSLTQQLRALGIAFDAHFTPQSLPCMNGFVVIR